MPFFRTLSSLNSAIPDTPLTTRRFDSTFDDVYFFLRPDSTVTDPTRNDLVTTNGTLGLTGAFTNRNNTNQTTFSPFLRPDGYWSAEVGTGVSYNVNFNAPINLEGDFTISFWYMPRLELQNSLRLTVPSGFSGFVAGSPNRAATIFELGTLKLVQDSITSLDSISVSLSLSLGTTSRQINNRFLINKWYFITITRKGIVNDNIKIYVDNVEQSTKFSDNTIFSNIRGVNFNTHRSINNFSVTVYSGGYGIGDFRIILNKSLIPQQRPALSPALEITTAVQLFYSYNTFKVGTNNATVSITRLPASIDSNNQRYFSKSFSFIATPKTGYQYRVPYNPTINGGSLRIVNESSPQNGVTFVVPESAQIPTNVPLTLEFWVYSNRADSEVLHIGNQIKIRTTSFTTVVNSRSQGNITETILSNVPQTAGSNTSLGTYGADRYNWTHFAIVKGNTNLHRVFKNGQSIGTFTLDETIFAGASNNFIRLGRSSSNFGENTFFIAGFRLIRNQALTTGNFTPPNGLINTTQVGWSGPFVATSITGEVLITTNFTNGHVGDGTGRASIQTNFLSTGLALRSNLQITKTVTFRSVNGLALDNVDNLRTGQEVAGNLFPIGPTVIQSIIPETRVITTRDLPSINLALPTGITIKNPSGTNPNVLEIRSTLPYRVDLNNTSNFDGFFDWHLEIRFQLTQFGKYGLFNISSIFPNSGEEIGFLIAIDANKLFQCVKRVTTSIVRSGIGQTGIRYNMTTQRGYITDTQQPLDLYQWYTLNVIQERQICYAYLNNAFKPTSYLDLTSATQFNINSFTINNVPSWANNFFTGINYANHGITYDYYRLSYNKFSSAETAPKLGARTIVNGISGIRPLVLQTPPLSPNG